MSESNICEICGGVKSFFYEIKPDDVSQRISTIVTPKKLCFGHPMDGPTKHDGKLDENGTLTVKFEDLRDGRVVEINQSPRDWLWFTPKEAISLLSWLEQNRAELTTLAEQERA